MKMRALFLATACVVSSIAAQAAAPAGTPAAPTAAPTAPVPLEIVVFDKPDYKGASLRIARPTADLGTLKFDNKVASFQIVRSGRLGAVREQELPGPLRPRSVAGRQSQAVPAERSRVIALSGSRSSPGASDDTGHNTRARINAQACKDELSRSSAHEMRRPPLK
jgi:hypothetical protein